MDRSYLVLWFAIALFVVLSAWGIYHLVTDESESPAPVPTTQPLVERLKAERERRLGQRAASNPATSE